MRWSLKQSQGLGSEGQVWSRVAVPSSEGLRVPWTAVWIAVGRAVFQLNLALSSVCVARVQCIFSFSYFTVKLRQEVCPQTHFS